MECKKCGQTFEDSFNSCPNCGENVKGKSNSKKSIFKKWWFWLIIVLVLGVILGSSGGGNKTETTTVADSEQTTVDSAGISSEDETAEVTTEADDGFIRVGEAVDASGLEITYISGEEYRDYNQYLPPKDGNIIVKASFNAVNNSSTDRIFSIYDFVCYADGVSAEAYYATDDSLSATLSTGRSGNCNVYFEVPEDAEKIEIEYEVNFWSGKKAIFLVELP